MATHYIVLAWRVPGTGKPGGLPSVGSHRVGHNWSDLEAAGREKDLGANLDGAKPGVGWQGPLQRLNNLKICPLSYLWCCKTCTHRRQSGHSHSGQFPRRLEARSEECIALSWSLNKTIYLISLTSTKETQEPLWNSSKLDTPIHLYKEQSDAKGG